MHKRITNSEALNYELRITGWNIGKNFLLIPNSEFRIPEKVGVAHA